MLRHLKTLILALLAAAAPAGDLRVTLLQTTDLHDHCKGACHVAAGPSARGGYARIAAYVEQVRAGCGNPVLLVDSGDWSMGTLYDLTLFRSPLALRFADALGYDCITLGNHEFDDGPAGLAGILRAAVQGPGLRTPILASNLEPNGDADLAPFLGGAIRPALVKTLANGLKVGFIGLMGRAAALDAGASAPVRFTDYRNGTLVQTLVDQLRAQGCRLVIALDHAGTDAEGRSGEDVDLARRVTGIDVIASGHAHNPLDSAQTVANGAWRTRILCAGAYGSNVARLDLAIPESGTPRLEASSNLPMADAALAALDPPVLPDPAFAAVLVNTDLELNRALAPVFTQVARFPDYQPDAPERGLYHPVATCLQDLPGAARDALPAPNGLGDLCVDAMRAAANGLRGADPSPFTAAALAAGELRGALEAGSPITFADLYGMMPLGRSPDPAQRGTTGEPLVSGYLDADGLHVLCAMQLLAQTGLAGPDDYLNLSGLSYGLNPSETAVFFTSASAATALGLTSLRASAGSAPAARAMAALASLPRDRGAALVAAAAGNPYAGALVRLDDPDPARIAEHLAVLGRVARAAGQDAGAGTTTLQALLMAEAMAAIGPVAAFPACDLACTGPVAPLPHGRHRVVLDLYMLMMMGGVQQQFGLDTAIYAAAQGDLQLGRTPSGLEAILANRLNLAPAGAFQELKGWMALLAYLSGPHFAGGRITAEYDSGGGFTGFPGFGAAVRTRNAAYPLDRVGALAAMASALRQAP